MFTWFILTLILSCTAACRTFSTYGSKTGFRPWQRRRFAPPSAVQEPLHVKAFLMVELGRRADTIGLTGLWLLTASNDGLTPDRTTSS